MPALNPFFSTEVPRNDDLCSQPEFPIMSAPPIVEKRSREVYSVVYSMLAAEPHPLANIWIVSSYLLPPLYQGANNYEWYSIV